MVTTCGTETPTYEVAPFSFMDVETVFDPEQRPVGKGVLSVGVTGEVAGHRFVGKEEFDYEVVASD